MEKMKLKFKESDITKQIRDYLNLRHIFHWKAWQGLGSKRGVADIIGLLPDGRFLAIEVKTPQGKLSPYQKEFLNEILNNNGLAIFAQSIDDVMKCIEPIIKRI
jgi:hypothetical protein